MNKKAFWLEIFVKREFYENTCELTRLISEKSILFEEIKKKKN